jgi:hypothetical protein
MAVACFMYLKTGENLNVEHTAAMHEPVVANVGHNSPTTCNQGARSATSNGWSSVNAASPTRSRKILEAAKLCVTIQNNAGAFRGEAKLVDVDRNGCDTIDGKIVRGQRFETLGESDEKGAETAINVAASADCLGSSSKLLNGIDDTLRKRRSTTNDNNCVAVNAGTSGSRQRSKGNGVDGEVS